MAQIHKNQEFYSDVCELVPQKPKHPGRILECFSRGIHLYIIFPLSNRSEVAKSIFITSAKQA